MGYELPYEPLEIPKDIMNSTKLAKYGITLDEWGCYWLKVANQKPVYLTPVDEKHRWIKTDADAVLYIYNSGVVKGVFAASDAAKMIRDKTCILNKK